MFLRKDAYQPFNAAAATPGKKKTLQDSYSEQKKRLSGLCKRFLTLGKQ